MTHTMTIHTRSVLLGAALMLVCGVAFAGAGGDTSRLWGVIHQAAAPAQTEGAAASLTADLSGRLRVIDAATGSVAGGGAEATAQRVTIANDSTGLVSIDDNAGSLTIDNAAIVGAATEGLEVHSDGIAVVASDFVTLAADINAIAPTANLRLHHVSLRESAGAAAAATIVIRNGALDTDESLLWFELAANGSSSWDSERGLNCADGVRIDVVAGTVDITIGTRAVASD